MLRASPRKLALFAASSLAAGALAAGAARAADAAPASTEVGEVVVTAQKTAERAIDVPLNVSSLSSGALKDAHVETPNDLAAQLPNVDIKDNIPGAQSIITVRGVGLDDFSSTNNSSVGVYVDDVFLASFAEMDFNFYDLDRIEVLKGPQGTLYGRNSTAGAINVISARPSFAGLSAEATVGYGNYRDFTAEGYVNVPVSDSLALRLSAKTNQQDSGYWFSRVLNDHLGQQHVLLARGQALWKPTDRLSVDLKLEGEHNRSSIGVGKFFGTIPTAAAPCPDLANPGHCVDQHGYTDTSPNPFTGDWNHRAPYRVDQWNATLHADDDLGWATLSSVTGYIDFKREFYIDADAAPTTDAEFDQNDHVRQFSQELRLAGKSGPLSWLGGAYYSWDRVQTNTPGFLTSLFVTDVLITADQTTRTGAVFGQAKWALTDRLSLTGGLRYTDETRHYVGGTTDTNPFGSSFLCFVVGACGFPPNPGAHVLTSQNASTSDRNWSWRAAVDYKPTADSLIYVSVSRGEKSGGFFNGITTNNAALAPFKPEQLTDYEAGVKWQSTDRRLRFAASGFYYDYHDLQTQTFTSVGAVSLIKLGNVPKAKVYGLDADVTWEAAAGLTLRGGLGLLHTELGSFQTANAGGVVTIPAGNRLPDAPSVTFNGSARYQHLVGGGFLAAVQVDVHYSASVFKEALNTPYLAAGPYWIENASVSLSTADGNWSGSVWVKNLADTRYVSQATDDGLGMGYRIFAPPRTYGLTVSHRFE